MVTTPARGKGGVDLEVLNLSQLIEQKTRDRRYLDRPSTSLLYL